MSTEEEDYYKILGVEKTANVKDITRAYRKLAMKFHPDVNKTEDANKMMEKINEAHQVLKDEEKRSLYDKYGKKGLEPGYRPGGGGGFFSQFFGGGFEHERKGPQKGQTVMRGLQVTLEELYNGAEKKVNLTRTKICKTCKGIGASKEDAVKVCKSCEGTGRKIVIKRMPGFVQQFQTYCNDCNGKGKSIDKQFICKDCGGKKVVSDNKTLEIIIDKGMNNNQKLTFESEADERPGILPGDIVFVLQQVPHKHFKRDGKNLHMEKKIQLSSALTGAQFKITHLDGRVIHVSSKVGDIIKPGDVRQIEGEGMPTWKDPFDKGNLYIKFEIEFPTKIPPNYITQLADLLPKPKTETIDEKSDKKVEVHELVEPTFDNRSENSRREAYMEDDDEEREVQSCPVN